MCVCVGGGGGGGVRNRFFLLCQNLYLVFKLQVLNQYCISLQPAQRSTTYKQP